MASEELAEPAVEDGQEAILLQTAPDRAVPEGVRAEGEGRERQDAVQRAEADDDQADRHGRHEGIAPRGAQIVDPEPDVDRALAGPDVGHETERRIEGEA